MSKTTTTSDSPIELTSGGVKVRVRWKFIVSVLGLLLGGGGLASIAAIFNVGSSVASDFDAFKSDQSFQHKKIDTTLEEQDSRAKLQDGRIEVISKAITSVQTTQQRDVARTEARRLSEKISNRKEREDTYDRLYVRNLDRLQAGKDPCANTNCD
jgi:hypothetical protein